MKSFESHNFELAQCQQELFELRELLDSSDDLGENDRLLPFFRSHRNLSAFIGSFNIEISRFNLIAFEYDLFGDFRCDLVIGDSERCAYTFVEFEDAGPKSLFVKQGRKATREWSPRLERGFGQIIDWFYKLHDRRNSDDCQARFGKRAIDFTGVLIVGRNQHMDEGEQLRLAWRREHVVVNSKHISCWTYDELYEILHERLNQFTMAAKAGDG